MFAQRGLILAAPRGWTSHRSRYMWGQESWTPSMFFECRSHKLWPRIILRIISTHICSTLKAEDKTKKITIELFCEQEPSFVCVCVCVFLLLYSFYSSLFLPAQANKLYQQIQLSNTRPCSIRPETNFGRQQWKKKKRIRPVLWGDIEGQNVNFPGKPSPVDWTVKRSSNAHSDTR